MKKGLLALAAGLFLTAGSASADWGVIGEFNSWGGDYAMTETSSGVWTATMESLKGQFKFRENGGWAVNLGADASGIKNITENGDFTLRQDGQNFRFTEEVKNVTFTLNTNTNVLTVSGLGGTIVVGPTETVMYLRGAMNSWGAEDAYKFTNKGDDIFELKLDELAAGQEFKIADADWADINFSSGNLAMGLDTPYECYYNNSNNMAMGSTVTNAVLTFDNNTHILTITGDGGGDEPTTVYALRGNFSGSWTNYPLTEADGVWTATNVGVAAGSEFGILVALSNAPDTQVGWINDAEYTSECLSGGNGANYSIAEAGTYDFTFNPTNNSLNVVKTGGYEVDYSTWWVNVIGDFNNWLDNGINPNEDGITVHENLAIGTSGFKVKVWNGAEMWHSNGEALRTDEFIAIPDNWDANMTVEGATETSVYNVEFNCATNEIRVTDVNTGINVIAASNGEATYFNMQGVRVANPEKGMFIRVQNGKAVKVVK